MADITNQLQAAAGAAGGGVGGSYLLYGTGSSTVGLLDHTTPGTLTFATSYTNAGTSILCAKFSPDGGYVATGNGNNGIITLLNRPTPSTFSFAATYTANAALDGGQLSISWSPDSNYIATARQNATGITLLNHTTPGSLSLASTYAAFTLSNVDFSPDGSYLITGYGDINAGLVTLYNHSAGSLTLATTYGTTSADATKFSPDGNYIAFWRRFTTLTVLDHTTPGTLSLAATYTITNVDSTISFGLDWTPDGEYVACGSSLTGGTRNVTLLSFSGSALTLATTYAMGGASQVYALKFSPDGNYLAVTGNTGVPVLTLLNHTTPGSLSLATTYSAFPFSADWSPD